MSAETAGPMTRARAGNNVLINGNHSQKYSREGRSNIPNEKEEMTRRYTKIFLRLISQKKK